MALTKRLWANNIRTSLAGAISPTALTLPVQSGVGATLPNPNNSLGEYFDLTLQDQATGLRIEIVAVTAVTGDVLTIVRGQQGTAAQSWYAGDTAFIPVTSGALTEMAQQHQVQQGAFSFAHDTGVADAYVITLSPAPELVDGMPIYFSTANTNASTTPTITINGTLVSITGKGGIPLIKNQISADFINNLVYRSVGPRFELQHYTGPEYLAKSVAGSTNVTLTALEASYRIINLTGARTANGSMTLPQAPGRWVIVNNTTGAYTITAIMPTGTGVDIPQGGSCAVYSDGTNIYYNTPIVSQAIAEAGASTSLWSWSSLRVRQAINAVSGSIPGPNLLINANFAVNQRALSSPVGLGIGEVGHDGWKGGASGGVYSYTKTAGVTTINITAASLIQVVSGDAIKSGQYVLSWQGSALARINGGSYLSSPIVYTAVGGANQTVEFQAGGTVALPKLELGTNPTACVLLKFETDLLACLPYRQKSYNQLLAPGAIGSNAGEFGFGVTSGSATNAGSKWSHSFNPPMNSTPILSLYSNGTGASGVIRALGPNADVTPTVSSLSTAGFTLDVTTGGTTTDQRFSGQFLAEAPL